MMKNYDDSVLFHCSVRGFAYLAFGAGTTITMMLAEDRTASDIIEAIELFEVTGKKIGYKKMIVFVDLYSAESGRIAEYAEVKKGKITWTDKRFIRYEWHI